MKQATNRQSLRGGLGPLPDKACLPAPVPTTTDHHKVLETVRGMEKSVARFVCWKSGVRLRHHDFEDLTSEVRYWFCYYVRQYDDKRGMKPSTYLFRAAKHWALEWVMRTVRRSQTTRLLDNHASHANGAFTEVEARDVWAWAMRTLDPLSRDIVVGYLRDGATQAGLGLKHKLRYSRVKEVYEAALLKLAEEMRRAEP